ncbi:MAG: hypothetical protein LBV12_07030 [Puniceicoccales bacterium]|jgi:hypothetical protein|nr:hypothetical protein [Puniceicoccales bacterium]
MFLAVIARADGSLWAPSNLRLSLSNIDGLVTVDGKITKSLLPSLLPSDITGLMDGNTIAQSLIPQITQDKLDFLFDDNGKIQTQYLPASSGGDGSQAGFNQDVSIYGHTLGVGTDAGPWNITLGPVPGAALGIYMGNGVALDATTTNLLKITGGTLQAALALTTYTSGMPLTTDSNGLIISSEMKYLAAPQAAPVSNVWIMPLAGSSGDRRLRFTTPLADFREQTVHLLVFVSAELIRNNSPQRLLSSLQDGDAGRDSEKIAWYFYIGTGGALIFRRIGYPEEKLGTLVSDRWHWISFAFIKKNFLNWELWVYVDGQVFVQLGLNRPEQVGSIGPEASPYQLSVGRMVVTDTKADLSDKLPEFGAIINGVSDGTGSIVFAPTTVASANTWNANTAGWSLNSSEAVLQVNNP